MSIATDPNAAVNDLADRFWDGVLERDPLWACVLGDERYNDRWPDLGPDGRAADEGSVSLGSRRGGAIASDDLEPEQVITRDLLILVAENHLEALAQKQYQLASTTCPAPRCGRCRPPSTSRPTRPSGWIGPRPIPAFPTMIEQYVGTLAEGVADGRTAAAVPVRRAIEQIDRLLSMPADAAPATAMVQVGDDDRLVAGGRGACLRRARRLRDFLVDEYEPHARPEPGLSTTPGGDDAYRLAIRMQTSLWPRLPRRCTPSASPTSSRSRARRTRSRGGSATPRPACAALGARGRPVQPHRRSRGARAAGAGKTDRAYALRSTSAACRRRTAT